MAQNLESISKNFQCSTRRTRILIGSIISTMLLHGTNRKSHGQNCVTLNKFKKKSQDSVHLYLQLAVISICRGEAGLGLCTFLRLAKTLRLRGGDLQGGEDS